jgi:glycosyltransferase involved in cell wall biosynthesis
LLGVPFVFGPVGGGEISPPGLGKGSGFCGDIAELSKKCATAFVSWFPPTRLLLQKAAWTFATTPQTEKALRAAGVTRLSVLPQSGISPADFPSLPIPDRSNAGSRSGPLQLITASRLIHWKAIDLAIEAVAVLPADLDVRLCVLQEGPEMGRLRKLVDTLGISDRVEFKGKLPSLAEVHTMISQADALIHPALHEAFGQACIEALALGTPVICLDWAGPGMIVDKSSGFAVPPGNRREIIQGIAGAIRSLHREKTEGETRRDACVARALGSFQWNHIADQIEGLYQQLEPTRFTKSENT